MAGVKRASPGADGEKDPFAGVDITDEENAKLQELVKLGKRTDLALERAAQKKFEPVYAKRRDVLKAIDRFWPVALRNNPTIGELSELNKDQQALSYLEDLWVVRDAKEPRVFTLEFHFKANPFFSDSVVKKEFKYTPHAAASEDKPDENGITDTMLEFDWERDVEGVATTIQWKDDAHNLVKAYPRKKAEAEEDDVLDVSDHGSFFNFFTSTEDPYDLGVIIADVIFPEAINYFLGNAEDMHLDSDDESDMDDDDDDAEEIDLEKPRSKKQKHA